MTKPVKREVKATTPGNIFAGGGNMGALMQAHDWLASPLGSIKQWSQSLQMALRILLSSNLPMQILWGPEYVQFYNDAYIPIAGDKHPKALGQKAEQWWQEVWDFASPLLNQVMATGEATWFKDRLLVVNRDGYLEECYFTFSYAPIWDEFGKVGGILITAAETTEKILSQCSERELGDEEQTAQANLERVLASISDEFMMFDRQWCLSYINNKAIDTFGKSSEELLGKSIWELYPQAIGTLLDREFHRAMAEQVVTEFEYYDTAQQCWFQNRVYPFATGLSLLRVDITKHKLLEEALQVSEARLNERKQAEEVLRNIAEGVSAATGDAFFHSLVQYLAKSLKTDYAFIAALIGETHQKVTTIAAYADGKHVDNFEYDLANTPCQKVVEQELCYYAKDIQKKFPQDSFLAEMAIESYVGTPLIDSSGCVLGLMVVLNRKPLDNPQTTVAMLQIFASRAAGELERRQAEQKIREQAALLSVATDAIFVTDLKNKILFWNTSAERLYGWKSEDILGRNPLELIYGTRTLSEQLLQIKKTLMEKGEWQGELQQIGKSGKEFIVASRWTLVTDEAGNPKSILIVNTDITEKKLLERQFLRDQRLESIGRLASGIAHDLNNILTPILGTAQLLQRKSSHFDELTQELVQILEKNSKRGAELVKQVLSFTRGVEGERRVTQVRHLLLEVKQIVQQTFPKNINVDSDIATDLWTVCADITQLHQVFMNLCVNARDAMPNGGSLRLCAQNLFVDETYAKMQLEAKVGNYVVIKVCDTGIGISEEIIDRIFEPFFTTKEVGQGTGLGLSTVIGIVKHHGGFIVVQSQLGKGSEFQVFLPAMGTLDVKAVENRDLPRGKGEYLLVADDETSIREVLKAILETHNYQVLSASDGIDAISVYAQNTTKISAVLMDMMMPSMDGSTAIRTLRRINPQVKIIAFSGLASNARLATDAGATAFLSKPYTEQDLLQTLHSCLTG
ncbi:hypothetical protein NUACC21_36070 [Scytonema sp. NUACC21]